MCCECHSIKYVSYNNEYTVQKTCSNKHQMQDRKDAKSAGCLKEIDLQNVTVENILDLLGIPGRRIGQAGQNCWGNGCLAKPPGWPRGRRVPDSGKQTPAQNCAAGYNIGCAPLPPGLWTAAGPSIQSGPGVYCQIYWEHWRGGEGKCVVSKTKDEGDCWLPNTHRYDTMKSYVALGSLFCCQCHAKTKQKNNPRCQTVVSLRHLKTEGANNSSDVGDF